MLHFFARRLNELHKEDRKGEKGFTLIELLVVVIIIGILAAIAIPAFLSQRERAQNGAAASDLRNAAAAATSCFSKNGGSYTTPTVCSKTEIANNHGFNETDGVTVTVPAPTTDTWTATSAHSNTSPVTYSYNSDDGKVVASG